MATPHGFHLRVNYARAIPDMEEASRKYMLNHSRCRCHNACQVPTLQYRKYADEQRWSKTDTFACLLVWNDDTKKL